MDLLKHWNKYEDTKEIVVMLSKELKNEKLRDARLTDKI
jgi:hypothetical protein